jgi:hypothetical protein
MAGSTISSTITHQVTLGYGVTISPLTITNHGDINVAAGYAILVSGGYDGTLINDGTIRGSTEAVYAAEYAVTIFNHGTIYGDQIGLLLNTGAGGPSVVVNSAAISGNVGIEGSGITLTNTGLVDGTDFGIRLNVSKVVNSGTIEGQTGVYLQQSTLTNTGAIDGSQTGLYIGGGTALNSGDISGVRGVQIANDAGDGTLINHGTISGGVTVAGGTLTNTARITGATGVTLGIAGNATNSGQIYGQSYGVVVSGPTNATNETFINSGTIYGQNEGIMISGAYARNTGSVSGGNAGVTISGGLLVNYGVISSRNIAVALSGGSLANSGTLTGQTDGVTISGGVVTNFETISGNVNGALLVGGSLANYGRISSADFGVNDAGGTVTNYGIISSASIGVTIAHGVLTNAGTIAGAGGDAVYGSFITLAVDPGAVFVGNVADSDGGGLLDLAGAGLGSLSGIGTQITGFKNISFTTGANWTIAGDTGGLGAGQTISGMTKADTIVLDGFAATSDSFVSGAGLELSNGTATVTLDITGNFSTSSFVVMESGGNTVIKEMACYAAGTRIATPAGNVAVEQLKIGDRVRTLDGDQAVKWIGWRCYEGRSIQGNLAALPVCIRQNALGDAVPARDLYVSPGHAIAIDNVLVHAVRLVNGVSVVQLREVESVTYYHVELQRHAIIFAENCPAESFHDEYFRTQFANVEDYRRLYPDQTAPAVMCRPRLDSGFELYAIQRRVAARAGIAEATVTGALRGYVDPRAGDCCYGWAQDLAAPERPVSLDIVSGTRLVGRVLANLYRADVFAAGHGSGYHGFELRLPAGLSGEIEVRRTVDGARLEIADTTVQKAA